MRAEAGGLQLAVAEQPAVDSSVVRVKGAVVGPFHAKVLTFGLGGDHLKVNRGPLADALQATDGTCDLTRDAGGAGGVVDVVTVCVKVANGPLSVRSVPVAIWRIVAFVVTSEIASFFMRMLSQQ